MNIQYGKQNSKFTYNVVKRKKLFTWMANASENSLCEVMKRINPSRFKGLYGPYLARLYALLASAEEVMTALELTGRKNPERDLSELERAHKARLAMISPVKQRRSPKKEKIALHDGVVRQLLGSGYSLRQVCAYLRKYADLKVNHSYLRRYCIEMEIHMPRAKSASESEGSHETDI